MIPLKLVAVNDTFGALVALGEVLAANQAVFITARGQWQDARDFWAT